MRTDVIRFLLAALLSATAAFSQTSTTELSGTVYDHTGAVLPGAIVSAVNDATGVSVKRVTNGAGLYAFPSMPVGKYTVTVEMAGFKTGRRQAVTLAVGTPIQEDVTLQLGDTREVINVEAVAE